MNQNKKFYLFFLIACFFQIVSLLWVLWPSAPTPRGVGLSWVAVHRLAECINEGTVTNWHCALFLYECLGIKYLVYHLSDRVLSGVEVLYGVWILLTTIMLVAIINLLYILGKRSAVWLAVFPCCVLLSFNRADDLFPVGLDYYFFCLIWCLIAAMFTYSRSAARKWRLGNVVLLLLLLMHLLAYRRNFVVAVPFIMGWLFYMFDWFRQRRMWQKLTIWGVGTAVLIFFSLTWVENVFPVQKEHPLSPMMESDMRIAAILRGDENPTVREGFQKLKGEPAESSITAYWYKIQEDKWEPFRNLYVKEWKEHPETMCAAGIIQRIQFFSGGHNCQFLKRAVERIYPVVRENDKAWEIAAPTVSSFRVRLFCLLMAPVCIVMGVIFMKRNVVAPEICFLVIITGSISALYASSYLIVVPTSDARYLAPSYMLTLLSIFLLVASILVVCVKRVRKQIGPLQN